MDGNLLMILQGKRQQEELAVLAKVNEDTAQFGLTLTEDEAKALMASRNESLARYRRIEFGRGILDKLIAAFCDSQYIEQDSYLETLEELQEIFYAFKHESGEKLTDDELLTFMKEQFESVCYGSTEYLRDTCLERYAAALRGGYEGHRKSQGRGEYGQLSQEMRWDNDLYMDVVKELFW